MMDDESRACLAEMMAKTDQWQEEVLARIESWMDDGQLEDLTRFMARGVGMVTPDERRTFLLNMTGILGLIGLARVLETKATRELEEQDEDG